MPSERKSNFDRNEKRLIKYILFIVVPILILIVGLMVLGQTDALRPSQLQIISEIDLHCYNVNWFGQHGFQVTYQESLVEIAQKLAEHDYDFKNSEFEANQAIVNYFVMTCPHIDSRLEVPDDYNPFLGINAYDKCLQRTADLFENEEFCSEYKQ